MSFFTGLFMFSAVSFEKTESARLVNVPRLLEGGRLGALLTREWRSV